MASASPLNRPATGLAGRPTRFMGGVRRRDESPDAFRDRMDTGRAGNAAPQAAPLGRRDNIIAARADGSFDGKVAAYNAAGAATGHSMDEAGNLIAPPPKALPLTGTRPAAGTVPMKPAAPRGPGLINGQPAAQAIVAVKGPQTAMPMAGAQKPVGGGGFKMPTVADALQPPAVTRNVTSNVTSRVTPPPAAPSLSGGMMPMASRIAQGMNTAMTSANPSIVLPRAQSIVQTGQQRQQTPATPPQAKPLWPAHTAARAVAVGKQATKPQPISRAGLGLPRSSRPSTPPTNLIVGR